MLVVSACRTPLAASPAPVDASASVETRLAAQNQLFEEQYESDLALNPERATAYGDLRYNDQLGDYSLAGMKKRHDADASFAARLKDISTDGFGDQDQLSHEVMQRLLLQRLDDYGFKEYEMPVNQMDGPQVRLADLPLSMPFDSVKHYEDYIARLRQVPRVFTQTEEVLRAGMAEKLMPVRFLLEKVPAQCDGVMTANPFLSSHREISGEHLGRRPATPDRGHHGSRRHAGAAGLPFVQQLHRGNLRAPGPNDPERRVIARRRAALPQRHQEPHHIEHAVAGGHPQHRAEGDRAHPGRHARHRARRRLRGPGRPTARRSRPTRSTFRSRRSRFSRISATTSRRWSGNCPSCSATCPVRP